MRQDWLRGDGVVLVDVFNPLAWCREAGTRSLDEETGCQQANDFDASEGCMVNSWWFDGDSDPPMAQSQRCYFPADLIMLLEGTGLRLLHVEVEGSSSTLSQLESTVQWVTLGAIECLSAGRSKKPAPSRPQRKHPRDLAFQKLTACLHTA
jgi:hypothetical protein